MNSSKTSDFEQPASISKHSIPEFSDDCEFLVEKLHKLSVSDFSKLTGVSEKLAVLNVERYENWQASPPHSQAKQAITICAGQKIFNPLI